MKKIDRKDFLKLGGGVAAGGIGGYVLSGAPFWGMQWVVEWTQDQYVAPKGLIRYVNSVNKNCPNGCEVSVRMSGKRAVKIESAKAICPSCKNTLQLIYHPERIASPMKRKGKKGSGKFESISWDQAIKEISGKLNSLIDEKKSDKIAAISKNESLAGQLMERFIKSAGSRNIYYENTRKSLETGALGGFMDYDFDNAGYVLSFGARLSEMWDSRIDLGKKVKEWEDGKVKFVQADSICSRTASMAGEWLPIKPGSEGALALGMAAYLIRTKRKSLNIRDFREWSKLIQKNFTLAETAKVTGLSEDKIKKIANEFFRARNPIAVSGKGGIGTTASSQEMIAVQVLNLLTGTRAASLKRNPSFSYPGKEKGLESFIEKGEFEFLFLTGSDPVYKSTMGQKLKEKMDKAMVVAITPIMNDSVKHADIILPPLHFLETGTKSVVAPRNESMDHADIIISVSKAVKRTATLFKGAPSSYRLNKKTVPAGRNFSMKFKETEKAILKEKESITSGKFNLVMVPFEVPLVGDGDGMAFPYVLKSIDATHFYRGRLFVHMNSETAKKEGLCQDEKIDIESQGGKLQNLYVNITDTVAPGTVAVPLGFGHDSYTKYGSNKGVNVKKIMNSETDPLTGSTDWWATPVKVI